jgi:mannose-6-phosphate isomerase-like protein (cupin superfamily)
MESGKIVSVKNAEHYLWGDNCEAWHLLKNDGLSVIEERMEPGSSERLHFHEKAQQLFYILSGAADMEIAGELIHLHAGETAHILPKVAHRILNQSDTELRFIVISAPRSHGDRVDL